MDTTVRRGYARLAILAAILAAPLAISEPLAQAANAPSAEATTAGFGSSIAVDWPAAIIRAEVELNLAALGFSLPSGRSQADRSLEAAVPDLVRGAVLGVELDSYRTVADSLLDGSLAPSLLEAFLERGRRTRSSLSRDLTRLQATYEWRLADLAELYVRHRVPLDLPEPPRYAPTRAYTGIVIFAQGQYEVRGEHRAGGIRPCLFPRLYDGDMRLLMERNLVAPEALRARGLVGYAYALDDPAIETRVGDSPLRVVASELFGSRRTDAVISVEDALKILGSPENRALVREGRVVIIIDRP
jgi:hypothetical protein